MGGEKETPTQDGTVNPPSNSEHSNEPTATTGLEGEKSAEETKNDLVPPQQTVSTSAVHETASVNSPLPEPDGISKPEDTTEEKTTQQNAVQEVQINSFQNWEYEQSIKKEEAEKTPLVCLTEDIQNLYQEYEHGSEVYRQKIMKLAERHSKIRRCRGDGNCFYRAFGFAWFEQLMESKNQSLRQSALKALTDMNSLLISAEYQSLAYEDAYDTVEKQMKAVTNGEHDADMLLTIFQTDEISNYIVYYLRLITAAYLKLHREEYEPFLELEIGMDHFCNTSVEGMDVEADHIHVIALTKALKVPVEIAYMSGSDAMEQVNFHEFYPDEEVKGTVTLKPLVLLYRPGHYDILYRRE